MTQVDRLTGLASTVALKAPVRAATTANITLSGEQTIDGVAVVADDRVLVQDQTTASENGIYVASTSAWERAVDFDGADDVVTGTLVTCNEGSTNAYGVFRVTTSGDIVPGTTSLTFEQPQNLNINTLVINTLTVTNVTISGNVTVADLTATGNVILGNASGDTLTVNGATWTIGANVTATRAMGAVSGVFGYTQNYTATGAAATDGGGYDTTFTLSGATAMSTAKAMQANLKHSGSATVTAGFTNHATMELTSTGNLTTGNVFSSGFTLSAAGAITTGRAYHARAPSLTSTGTITTLHGFSTADLGHANVTTAIGFNAADMTNSTNMRGFVGALTSGSGKFNVYCSGNADNAFAGNVRIGSVTAPTVALDVTGSVLISSIVAIGGSTNAADQLRLSATSITSGTTQRGVNVTGTFSTAATTTVRGVQTAFSLANGGGVTYTQVYGFAHTDTTVNAADTLTTQVGFNAAAMTTGTNIYGFRGEVAAATDRYNLYMSGTAQNYLVGVTGIGIAPSSTAALALAAGTTGVASLRVPHGSAPTSPVNGDIWTTTAGIFVRINGASVGPLS